MKNLESYFEISEIEFLTVYFGVLAEHDFLTVEHYLPIFSDSTRWHYWKGEIYFYCDLMILAFVFPLVRDCNYFKFRTGIRILNF